ncbi:TPA: T9SS type A sorting domain-containing protein, partial [bacterium]|nr:T9SS type A sorting domain-containing protein [bacterium]
DIFVAKYNPQGDFIWARGTGSTGEFDNAAAIDVDSQSNVYLAGNFQNTVDFNPGYQVHNVTSLGQTDAYVLKLSQCNNTGLIINETVCDLYTLNGIDYDSSGTFYQYYVNSQGCDSIITINLTVNASPVIVASPDTINKCINGWVDINVIATGTPPLTYQWYKDGTIITGATTEQFHINGLQASDDGFYTCEITSSCGSVITDGTALQIIQITVDPGSDVAFCNNNPVQLMATATSNYPAVSGSFSYLWSPPEGLNATNIPNPLAQPLGNTQYQIVASDQLGCQGMSFLNVLSNTPATISQQPQPQYKPCVSDDLMLSVQASGSSPLSYQWKKNGNPVPMANDPDLSIQNIAVSDEGIYTCEVSNLCNLVSTNNIEVNVIQLSLTASADTGMCKGQSASLSASAVSNHPAQSGTLNYSWSPGTGLNTVQGQNVVANPNVPVDYSVLVTDMNGCTVSENISVDVYLPFADEEICLVTVDTLSWKNKILWEKSPGVGTVGYNIYKEVASNVYSSIGFIPYADPAEYVDIYSQPESYANRYKISVVDTCGNESEKSFYHNTMNLTIAAFGSTMGLTWTPYSDESGTFMPALYDIYRGTTPYNMTYLASIPGTQTSYNDVNIFSVYHYIVGVTKPGGCNTSKADMKSFSNRKDNTAFIGIGETLLLPGTVIISPNPMSTSTTLTIPNLAQSQWSMANGRLVIMDVTGKVVRTQPLTHGLSPDKASLAQLTIDRGDLKPGIYFVELNAGRVYRGKLVVE